MLASNYFFTHLGLEVSGFPLKPGHEMQCTNARLVGVYLSMFWCNRWPKQTFLPLMVGSIVEALGVGLMAWALWKGHEPTIFGMIALTGAGTGMRFMPGM